MKWSTFREMMIARLGLNEIQDICFDLQIDYESIGGDTKNDKIRGLLELIIKNNRVADLVDQLEKRRPNSGWEAILDQPYSGFERIVDGPKRHWLIGGGIGLLLVVIAIVAFQVLRGGVDGEGSEPADVAMPTASISLDDLEEAPTNTPAPIPTFTATIIEPTPSITTVSSRPVVEPVAEGEQMILVALIRQESGAAPRRVSDEIVDDLVQKLEIEVPFYKVGVRQYPEVVTSKQQAVDIAEEVGAAVVIWGSYTDEAIELQIQVGTLSTFPDMKFERAELEDLLNVQMTLTDTESQSAAIDALIILGIIHVTANEPLDSALIMASAQLLDKQLGELVGTSRAVLYHAGFRAHTQGDFEEAADQFNRILDITPNALTYLARGITNIKLKQIASAERDLESAERLGPDGWLVPSLYLAFSSLIKRDIAAENSDLDTIVNARPEDWFVYYTRGLAHYAQHDYIKAKADFDRSIQLEPDLNWPYIFAMQLALREGNVIKVQELANTVVKEFPDANLGSRAMVVTFGDDTTIGYTIAATSKMLIGQFDEALDEIETAVAIEEQFPDAQKVADIYWSLGFIQCNLDNLEAAEEAYTRSLEIEPTFTLAHFSRATLRLQQGDSEGAEADFQYIEENAPNSFFAFGLTSARAGSNSCKSFLNLR